jgi:hypothetical protein
MGRTPWLVLAVDLTLAPVDRVAVSAPAIDALGA